MRKSSRVKGFAILTAAVMLAGLGSAELTQAADEEAAKVASLIDAIYVQQRTDETDALCEEAKGPIKNNLPDPDEYPQDKIDFTIKDLKAYNFSLVAEEPHLQDLIETFIEKFEKAESSEDDLEKDFVLSKEDLLDHTLTDEEAADYQRFLEDEIAADAEALLAEIGGENES